MSTKSSRDKENCFNMALQALRLVARNEPRDQRGPQYEQIDRAIARGTFALLFGLFLDHFDSLFRAGPPQEL